MAEFFESPTEGYLDGLTKAQLRIVAEHYHFSESLPKDLNKQGLKDSVKQHLLERSVIAGKSDPVNPTAASTPTRADAGAPSHGSAFSFEQQMEFLKMREAARDKDREVEVEKMRQDRELEFEKLKLERERMRLMAEGKIVGTGAGDSSGSSGRAGAENLSNMIKFLPKLTEIPTFSFLFLKELLIGGVGTTQSAPC